MLLFVARFFWDACRCWLDYARKRAKGQIVCSVLLVTVPKSRVLGHDGLHDTARGVDDWRRSVTNKGGGTFG